MLKKSAIHIIDFLLKPFYGRKYFQSFFGLLHSISIKGMNMRHISPSVNGEMWVIKYICNYYKLKQIEPIIFDIGANQGAYSSALIQAFKNKLILYCFEPSKQTYQLLNKNLKNISSINIYLHNIGFSNEHSILQLYLNQNNHSISSVFPRDHTFVVDYDSSEEIEVTRVDNFCDENGISHIHFMKIDVEGNEMNVLRGAKQLIKSNRIDFIQFEFSPRNVDARSYLRDFYHLLGKNFVIYRILKDGIYLLDSYSYDYEIFIESNYLAVNRSINLSIHR